MGRRVLSDELLRPRNAIAECRTTGIRTKKGKHFDSQEFFAKLEKGKNVNRLRDFSYLPSIWLSVVFGKSRRLAARTPLALSR